MSYPNAYSDSGGGSDYRHNQGRYQDNNLDYDPYTKPSYPTYDQSGYDAPPYDPSSYNYDSTYPPKQNPTHHHSESGVGMLHERQNSYPFAREFATSSTPAERTPGALRQYRYDVRGPLWMKGGRGRCIGRFCCCTIMTAVFLILSIVLALALWVRPPGIAIGDVAPIARQGSAVAIQGSGANVNLTANLGLNITVQNPNYFSVSFKEIKAELFYPIRKTPVGGGIGQNIEFPSHTETAWTFPFQIQYNSTADPQREILKDLVSKCGATKSDVSIDYKITLGLRILFITISPTISNTLSMPCPVDEATLQQLGGALGDLLGS